MPIDGLSATRRIPRLGKFRLGIKDPDRGFPKKVDYFVLPKDNPAYQDIVKTFGEKPKELRILIPVEDEEKWCSQYYRCYSKTRGLICKGDGLTAVRMVDTVTGQLADAGSKQVENREVKCAGRNCPDYKVKCKEVMNLQFLLPEIPGLGVWQIDTGSINSIININSTAELIKNIYKRISMIPLLLTLEPKEVNNPTDGKKQTVYVLNLRVNMRLNDLAQLARKQTELLELPVGDDEAPDFAPEFEPDPVEVAPDTRPIDQVIDDLWGPGSETKQPLGAEVKQEPPKQPVRQGKPTKQEPIFTDEDFR